MRGAGAVNPRGRIAGPRGALGKGGAARWGEGEGEGEGGAGKAKNEKGRGLRRGPFPDPPW